MPEEYLNSLPIISIIIPTHNRREALRRNLSALNQQTYPLERIEVIVVADGCHDGTSEMVAEFDSQFNLKLTELDGCGASCARNAGASKANGEIIMFLDDDVEASPELVEMHVNKHLERDNLAVIGYFIPRLETQRGFFRIELRIWWENMFDRMRTEGHRFNYQDLLTGNVSLARSLFFQVGEFDESFSVHEDYEFGYRLIKAGVQLEFCDQARGYHYEKSDLEKALKRKFEEGKADVLLGNKYPELKPTLLLWILNENSSVLIRTVRYLAFRAAFMSGFISTIARNLLWIFEFFRVRSLWRRTMDGLMAYWYWRGASRLLDFPAGYERFFKEYQDFIKKEPSSTPIILDLACGLLTAENQLDQIRPSSVVISYGSRSIGFVPSKPGAERLRGIHLRGILARDLFEELSWFLASSSPLDILQSPARVDR